MLTINPRIATFPGWETDPYYGANEAYTVVQPDLQNPFTSPILPPSTKAHITDIRQPLESPLSPADNPHLAKHCAEPAPSVSVSTSTPPTGDSQTLPTSAKSPTPPKTPRVLRRGHDRKRPAGHIPRPPNAFILYRSDFLRNKHKIIPLDNVDQQKLSIVAGKLWRHLDAETREYWYNLSREGEVSHTVKHPNYQYSPTRKEAGEEAQKRRQSTTKEEKKRICDKIIETYLPDAIKRPVVESPAPRKRKSRAKPKAEPKPRKRTSRASPSSSSIPAIDPSIVVPVDVSANEIPQASAPQSAVCGSSATNAIPQAPLAVAEPTAVNELYARYNRDKAAGRCTTSDMFIAQYNDQSSFLPKTHSQFLPSSQIQVEYSSMVPDYFSEDVFQNLVLPPAAVSGTVVASYPSHPVDVSVAQSGAGDWADVVQTSAVQNTTPMSGSDSFNNVFHGTSPVNFPLTIASANPYPDVQLIEPQFISSDDLSQINLNLDGLNFLLFNNIDSVPSVDQFTDHEGSFGAAAYGFNDNDGGMNIPAGVDLVANQDVGSGSFNGVYDTGVGHVSSADYAIVDQADNQYHVSTTNTEPQPTVTINPSEISINPNGLGSTFDHQVTGTAQDSFVYDAPKFYNLDHHNSLGFVNTETGYNQDCGYNNFTNFNNVAHVGPPTYIPTTTHSEAPGFDTNINHTEGYGAYNHNPYINSPVGIPGIVQAENNALGLDFSGQESIPTALNHGYHHHHHHHHSETSPNVHMYYDNPVLSGVLIPDKPPPYMYQSALDVPTNANANDYGNWTGNNNYQGVVSAVDASQWVSALAGIGNVN